MNNHESSSEAIAALKQLESLIGAELPSDYRRFLLRCEPWERTIPPLAVRVGPRDRYPDLLDIDTMFELCERRFVSLGRPAKAITVAWMTEVLRERLCGDGVVPADAVPVAGVITDAYVIIYTHGPHRGEVWLKSFDRLDREGIDEPNDDLRFLAKDFDTFLAGLVRNPS